MRVLVIIFLVVVVIAAASPLLIGSKVESSMRDQLAQFDDLPFYAVEVETYEKGYLSSQAIVSVGFDEAMLEAIAADFDDSSDFDASEIAEGLNLYLDIQHGPVLTKHGLSVGAADMSASFDRETYPEYVEFFDALGHDILMEWGMHVGLTGSGWFESDIPDVDTSFQEGDDQIHLVWKGYDAKSTFTDFGAFIESKGSIEEILVEFSGQESGSFSMKEMHADSEMTITDSIWMGLGTVEASIGSMQFDADDFSMAMEDTVFHATVTEGNSSETLNVRESIRMESADFNGYLVENAEFAFAYANISKALFQAYMESSEEFAKLNSGEISAEMKEKFEPILKDSLRYSPRFDLESVAFESDSGSLKASASFGIDSASLNSDIDFDNPYSLIPALTALADIEISESLLRAIMVLQTKSQMGEVPEEERPDEEQLAQMADMQIGMMSGMLEQQGYIKKEGENYSSSFSFSNGIAALNGQPIPIPGL